MQKGKKDNITLELFNIEKEYRDTIVNIEPSSNVIYLADVFKKKRELEKKDERNSILRAFLNHAKQLNW